MDSTYNHLDVATQTLYAELLERLLTEDELIPPSGGFMSKTVKGQLYWYLQLRSLGKRRQIYLGPDSESLRSEMARIASRWKDDAEKAESTGKLVAMLVAGGAQGPDARTGSLLDVLARHHVFAAGATLVGSLAFVAYGPMLGIAWRGAYRTADVDLASERRLALAIPHADVPEALEDSPFVFSAIPGFDPRSPSTSFRSRGTDLRLDVLTPEVGPPTREPIHLEHLGIAAQPLRFLDYLIEETVPAALVHRRGVLAHVPQPARFALHKLLVAEERGVHEATKSGKDLRQASALIELLHEDRPGDLELAAEALLARGPRWKSRARKAATKLEPRVRKLTKALLA